MTNKEINDEEFIINLTIDGTEYKDVEVTVSKPELPMLEQIRRIVKVFELPETYSWGDKRQYLIGLVTNEESEPMVLDYEDEEGRQQTLLDYNIKSGEHLYMFEPALYGCPPPMQKRKNSKD